MLKLIRYVLYATVKLTLSREWKRKTLRVGRSTRVRHFIKRNQGIFIAKLFNFELVLLFSFSMTSPA